uniref:UDP-glycosyltransferase n=1 Tax=Timema monikensis TaxID=170555 RepID=A0A7R9HL94_9NEOP|nr:unnamed protein product [Timema monikensis]
MKLWTSLPLFLMCYQVYGANILGLLTLTSYSHHIWNRSLMQALAARGHQVTVVSPDSDPNTGPNLTYILLEGSYENIMDNFKFSGGWDDSLYQRTSFLAKWSFFNCEYQMSTKGMKKILGYPDGKVFDLIISEAAFTECFMTLIPKFGDPPVVLVSGVGIPPFVDKMTGTPATPSYIPDYQLPLSETMDFQERFLNFITYLVNDIFHTYYYLPKLEEIASRHLGYKVKSIDELRRNISILLSNSFHGFDTPRPLMPNVIPVGGMHLKPASPLPKNLKTFLDGAKNGAIVFALGSNVRSDQLAPETRKALLDAFSQLPQRILWKFETEDLPGKPDNVMISKWLPQSDVLVHNFHIFQTTTIGLLKVSSMCRYFLGIRANKVAAPALASSMTPFFGPAPFCWLMNPFALQQVSRVSYSPVSTILAPLVATSTPSAIRAWSETDSRAVILTTRGHPNVKLFITHCGLYSTQEAIYFGVPVVGIPFFMDQHSNFYRLRELGVGEGLVFSSLTKDKILNTINAVIKNSSYASNMKRLSAIFHDQPDTPLERAVYWTEYVLRHGGAPHLRSVAVDMPLYQYLLLDVGLVLLLLLGTVSAALVLLARLLWHVLRNKSKQKQQ